MDVSTNIRRWGNSQGIMLSKKLLSSIGISDPLHQEVTIHLEEDELIIKKKSEQSRLMARFGSEKNEKSQVGQREFDWGDSKGKEFF